MFSPVALYIVGIMSGAVSAAVLVSLLRSEVPGLLRWIGAKRPDRGLDVRIGIEWRLTPFQPGETLADLMARVDAALYSAKAMGRNRVVSAIPAKNQMVVETVKDASDRT